MSVNPTNSLELYKEKGLTDKEASLVENWVARGRPGISKLKADQLATLYLMGYSCEDINREFPEYELPILLWARVNYLWDEMRENYRRGLSEQIVQAALTAKAESIRFVTDMMAATHASWRKEIMKYLAAPDREERPKCLPNNLHQYSQLVQLLEGLVSPEKTTRGPSEASPAQVPLVAINFGADKAPKDITPEDVKQAIIRDIKGDKKE